MLKTGNHYVLMCSGKPSPSLEIQDMGSKFKTFVAKLDNFVAVTANTFTALPLSGHGNVELKFGALSSKASVVCLFVYFVFDAFSLCIYVVVIIMVVGLCAGHHIEVFALFVSHPTGQRRERQVKSVG